MFTITSCMAISVTATILGPYSFSGPSTDSTQDSSVQ